MKKLQNLYKKAGAISIVFLLTLSISQKVGAKVVYVKKPSVNLRNEPSRESSVRTILVQDEKLETIGENRYWYQVNTQKGDTGWITKSLVTEEIPMDERFEQKKSENQTLKEEILHLQKEVEKRNGYKEEMGKKIRKMENEIRKTMEENKRLLVENKYLSSIKNIIFILIGISIFVIGWLFGFLTGFYKKVAENKRLENMIFKAKSKFKK